MADGERSAAEREAARLERERRRAAQPDEGPVAGDGGEPDLDGGDDDYDYFEDVPIGTRRVTRSQRPAAAGERAAAPRAARRGRRTANRARRPTVARGAGSQRKAHTWSGRVFAAIMVIVAAAAIWFLVELFQPLHGSGHGSVTVTIPPHSSSKQVGNLLAHDGVIGSSFFFDLRATLDGDRGSLLSGTYHLKRDMSYGDVLKLLTTAPPAARVTELTTTPGRTRDGLSELLRAQGVKGDYFQATKHSPLLRPEQYGAPTNTPSLEGFMFPDTYQLRVPIQLSALIADQLNRFKQEFATISFGYARSRHLTPYDVLIIASLVQAEGQTAHDMPLVASVIYNRLQDGMMLQFDSTTRYATGNFSRPLTVSELKSPSPWNTHTHTGLPPTPIDNPAMEAIRAAANPPRTDDLYFVSKPCSGSLAFAASYPQFLKDVAAFDATQSQNGAPPKKRC